MWGIIPAAAPGARVQALAFSKEPLPVGGRAEAPADRLGTVSEYLVDRMVAGGADKICFVIAPDQSDIVEYHGRRAATAADIAYVVQPRATGLCDAIFRAAPVIARDEPVLIGLPDTIWFPADACRALPDDRLSFLLLPVDEPRFFDAVVTDDDGKMREIHVKSARASSNWIWGAFKMPGEVFHALHHFWRSGPEPDEYVGPLINDWIAHGGTAIGVRAAESCVDVGTLDGYRAAMQLLGPAQRSEAAALG